MFLILNNIRQQGYEALETFKKLLDINNEIKITSTRKDFLLKFRSDTSDYKNLSA